MFNGRGAGGPKPSKWTAAGRVRFGTFFGGPKAPSSTEAQAGEPSAAGLEEATEPTVAAEAAATVEEPDPIPPSEPSAPASPADASDASEAAREEPEERAPFKSVEMMASVESTRTLIRWIAASKLQGVTWGIVGSNFRRSV